jgi:hypothetical protein
MTLFVCYLRLLSGMFPFDMALFKNHLNDFICHSMLRLPARDFYWCFFVFVPFAPAMTTGPSSVCRNSYAYYVTHMTWHALT